ncbi:aerolysin [Listeria ivanovii FSL F6-596]|nr:aerolysin [Listeria ivanovii FSL F6-596]
MRFTKTTESANQILFKKQLTRDAFAAKIAALYLKDNYTHRDNRPN